MRPGDVIVRRFEIERLVGSGGMGSVYRARDRETGKPVAVKQLDIRGKNDAERFTREAAVLADLRHSGIVRYVDHGRTETGDHFIAMEWLDGITLAERLKSGAMSVIETVQLGIRVATAISEAHRRSIVHRDIKPPNLFLPGGSIDRVKVLDFGVARLTGHAATGPTMTRTGALIGTPGYMAPEQARGVKDLDGRADVFALGSVLFECLTGKPPFSGANVMAVLAKILLEEAPHVRELRPDTPIALDGLISEMLSKEPASRPKDGDAVAAALASLTFGELHEGMSYFPTLIDEEPPTRPPALTTNEQRVFCVVLAGQMEGTAETLTPEAAHTSNTELYRVVDSFEGQLDMLMDGSLLVSLTARGAATDLAARSARCALAVRSLLGDAPIVLATGRGVISARMPVGEVIDRAARALTHADAGPIRLDNVSAGLLEGAGFELGNDPRGSFLRAEAEAISTRRTLLGKATKCVGRDRELITLEAIFTECTQEPVARAVLITGAPGIGKSRVRYELLQRVKARCEEMTVLTARGDSLRAGSPFAMIADAICKTAGVKDGEPVDDRRKKLMERVSRTLGRERAAKVAPFLGELANIPFETEVIEGARNDAMLMGDAMRAAWEDWLGAETRAQPVLIVLEDLQWGDLPSVKFVDAALRNLTDAPLMVVAVGRPEVHEQFPSLWSERGIQELRLGPLTKKASEKLIHNVLGEEVGEEMTRLLVEKADGNPFYLEELIRAIASGAGDSLPETVLGMVQARLDGLGPETKRVLRAASVFGGTFWRGGVLAMLGGSDSTTRVSESLDDIVEREIIAKSLTSAFPEEIEYNFRQSLVREAAYAMLTDEDRRLGHRLAGDWLESAGVRDVIVLGEHFDRGGEPEKAMRFFRRGAEQALEGNDFRAANARAERAIASGASGEVLGALELIRGEAFGWLGEPANAEKHLEDAAFLLPQGSLQWFRAVSELIASIVRQGAIDRVERWIDRAAAASATEGATGAQVSCLARAAENMLLVGKYEIAGGLLEQIERIIGGDRFIEPLAIARVHRFRARRALHAGDPGAYVLGLIEAYRAFEDAGDMRNATNERMNLGFAYSEVGEYELAERALKTALASAKRMGLSHVVAWADNNLGNVLGRRGQHDDARVIETRAIEAGRAQGDPRLEGNSRLYLSLIELAAGNPTAAEAQARESATILGKVPALRAVALAAHALALLRLERGKEAAVAAKQAMEVLQELGGLEEGEAMVRLAYAEALHIEGDRNAARRAIATARDRLYARAARIDDQRWRQSFLTQVSENARTVQLAETWGAEESATLRD